MTFESKYGIGDKVWVHKRTYSETFCECCKTHTKKFDIFVPEQYEICSVTFCYGGGVQYWLDKDCMSVWEYCICLTQEECQKKCDVFNKADKLIGKIVVEAEDDRD